MKPNRNDPCPCGSGKKYKQCCLKTEQVQPEDDFLWRRIRRAIEGSPPQLLSFGGSHFGQKALLMDIERSGKRTTPPLDPAIIAELRERLGL